MEHEHAYFRDEREAKWVTKWPLLSHLRTFAGHVFPIEAREEGSEGKKRDGTSDSIGTQHSFALLCQPFLPWVLDTSSLEPFSSVGFKSASENDEEMIMGRETPTDDLEAIPCHAYSRALLHEWGHGSYKCSSKMKKGPYFLLFVELF